MEFKHVVGRSTSIETRYSGREWPGAPRVSRIAARLLAVGLILGVSWIIVAPAEAHPADSAARGVDFDFVDHELRYAGGYALVLAGPSGCKADFAFLDHELERAGGYDLRPASVVDRGEGFAFLDHELEYAGRYDLRPAPVVERGEGFAFLDHELERAGGYGLRRAPVVERGEEFAFLDHELERAGGYELVRARLSLVTADLSCLSE